MTTFQRVSGFCPMGCGQTLFLAEGGYVTCSLLSCPNPAAASELLDDRETDHVMTVTHAGFMLRHPLRERIGGQLERCDVFDRIQSTTVGLWESTTGIPWGSVTPGVAFVVTDNLLMGRAES